MIRATSDFSIAALSRRGSTVAKLSDAFSADQRHLLTEEPRSLDFSLTFATGERLTIRLLGNGSEPTSFWKVLCGFRDLASLPANWDSYGSRPLSVSAVKRSFNLLPQLLAPSAPEPVMVPTSDGGVQFEWHRSGIDVEIRVPQQGPVSFLVADASTGQEVEGEGNLDLQTIREALERLSQIT
jgi:hypothetical protein